MLQIKRLKESLPLSIDEDLELNIIDISDLHKYVNILRSEYYQRYTDFDFSGMDRKVLVKIMENQIQYARRGSEVPDETRLLLKNKKTNEIVGGCTIYELGNIQNIELAYFILEKYKSRGICKKMLSRLITMLTQNLNITYILLEIRQDNKPSIKIAETLGFRLTDTKQGKFKTNYIYTMQQ